MSLDALAWLRQAGRGRSCSNIARPSTRPTRAISARSPRRCSTRCRARQRLHPLLPRLPRGGAHDLQGLSLRRRRAAVGIGDEGPSADADARPFAGAGAAAPEPRQGRPRPARHRGAGPQAIAAAFARLKQDGFRHAIVDAIADRDLEAIGEAAADFALITGGSGIALGLPENFRRQGLIGDGGGADVLPKIGGTAAVLSGSCSQATLGQVAHMRERAPTFAIDPLAAAAGQDVAAAALAWAGDELGDDPICFAATAPPDQVAVAQQKLGRERAGALVESIMAAIARGLVARGAPPGRRRRRDRRRGGAGARGQRAAHRPADRPRRAVDGQPPRQPSASRRWR